MTHPNPTFRRHERVKVGAYEVDDLPRTRKKTSLLYQAVRHPLAQNEHQLGRRTFPGNGKAVQTKTFGIEGMFTNEHDVATVNSEGAVAQRASVSTAIGSISIPTMKYTKPSRRVSQYSTGTQFLPTTKQLFETQMQFGDQFQMSRPLRYFRGPRVISEETHNASDTLYHTNMNNLSCKRH